MLEDCLLDDYVTVNATLENANAATQQWLKKFWKVFKLIGVQLDAIADYPLIPTLRNRYVSLSHCRTSSVIVADLSRHRLQAECLTQMHFELVNWTALPKDVRSSLPAAPSIY
jgi:sacsin